MSLDNFFFLNHEYSATSETGFHELRVIQMMKKPHVDTVALFFKSHVIW